MNDFADTAALMEVLDLVISVDTSTAHLAGALGKPVWILVGYDACWRWMLDREESPWYPTARLFRQRSFNDWDPVIEEVCAALQVFAGGGAAPRPTSRLPVKASYSAIAPGWGWSN